MTALNDYENVFALNQTFLHDINARAEQCGYFSFMEEALTFPPSHKFTAPNDSAPGTLCSRFPPQEVPNFNQVPTGCGVWDDIVAAAVYVNPCLNVYHLTDFCPFLWDELGFPSLAAVNCPLPL